MARVLIVYDTKEGQTGKISQAIANELSRCGNTVDTTRVSEMSYYLESLEYDGVIIGAPVHYSGFPRTIRRWVKRNAQCLPVRTGAFFSVCLAILQKHDPRAQDQEKRIVREFFKQTGWQPSYWSIIPGALPYSKYGIFKRIMMREIARRAGGDTDTRSDYEYTDWEQVRRFARNFDQLLKEQIPSSGFERSAI